MPALHNRVFDIRSSFTDNYNSFDNLVGVKLDIILEMINSEDITIEYARGELYLGWDIKGEEFSAIFIECENY